LNRVSKGSDMFDYEKIRERVALDCRDTEGDYNDEIEVAFELAVIDLNRESFFTNEIRQAVLELKQGQSLYDDPYGFYSIEKMELNFNNIALPMQKVRPGENDVFVKNDPPGPPLWWDYFQGQFKVFPCPDRDYQALVYSNMSARNNKDDDTSYDDEVFPYLYYLTKYYLAANTLNDTDMAQTALNGWQKQKSDMERLTEMKKRTGRIASNW